MTIDRAVLAQDVAALVADKARAVDFADAYGDRLAGVIRRILRDLGHGHLAGVDDEVQGLVWDAVLVIHDHGASWDPDGALPWSWAYRAIRSEVAAFIGHARADVDPDDLAEREEVAPASAEDIDIEALARTNPLIGLWWEAVAATGTSERNRLVHAEYRLQHSCGDPSPALTVARHLGLSAANVRQIDRRVRVALAEVVSADGRYRRLWDIPWLDLPPTAPPHGALQCMAVAAA